MCCLIYKFLLILTQKMQISFLKILPENALKFVSKKMRICVKNFAQLQCGYFSSKEEMRKITARIVHFFIESKVIDETDQEIYEYGLEILSENVMLTVFLLLFGVMIGKGIETCIFLFSFCWLRRFCGGYHAKTKRGCHIATFITYIVFLLGIVAFYKVVNKYMFAIYFVCLLILIVYAPVQHKNKVLTESICKKNRIKAIGYTLLFGSIIYIFKFKLPMVSVAVLATLIEVALLMIIGRRENGD